MGKETVLAKIRASLDFSEETPSWLDKLPEDICFRKEEGSAFFSKLGGNWKESLVGTAQRDSGDRR